MRWKPILAIPLLFAAFSLGACRVEKTEEGELPTVNIDVEEGRLPEYEIDTAEVEFGTEEKTVTVPTIDIHMPDEKPDTDPDDRADPNDPNPR